LRSSLEAVKDEPEVGEVGSSLDTNRDGRRTVPLIFIAHSLGGLIVKEVSIASFQPDVSNST